MSLMRLLAVGKSIIGLSAGRSPYRMRQENLLPKFGPAKGAKAKPPGPAEAATAIPAITPQGKEPDLRQPVAETKGNQMDVPVAGTKTPIEPGALQKAVPPPYPLGRWARLRNPFYTTLSKESRSVPVQGELLLETVKVMRNDLSDASPEVVRHVENACSRGENRQAEAADYSESSRLLVGKMTARLLEAGRT